MGLKDRVTQRIGRLRKRRPIVDHLFRTAEHYSAVKGSLQAGAVTYFAFLSFFPILALAFAVIGYVAGVYRDAQTDLVQAVSDVLPGMVSQQEAEGKIAITDLQAAAPGIFTIGLLVMLYSGLGWISAMRDALLVVFERPPDEQPSFVKGKLRDLIALILLGVVLLLSVGISGVITSLAKPVLEFLHLGIGASPLLWLIALALALAANSVLFFAFFKLLGDPDDPQRSLWSGALLGAVGFELLKQLSRFLIASTTDQPAFKAFGIALILLVWINYFSRVVMYAAAWAHTSAEAREIRERRALARARMEELTRVDLHEAAPGTAGRSRTAKSFAAGGATAIALVAVARRRKKEHS
ncbi:MAG TPA: YihY/virulence factor BrkB family protein [Nocardioides sp.]|nr:YihY/virulence factor BrkB family protein [Nocardioides sp.]